jgi:hypothetical protein
MRKGRIPDCPLEVITPTASDGHRGLGVLRKPPGRGFFPAIIYLHGGITTMPIASLRSTAKDGANPSRFLAAGYVIIQKDQILLGRAGHHSPELLVAPQEERREKHSLDKLTRGHGL